MSDKTPNIQFRVPAHIARQLQEAGATQKMSMNEYARELVVKGLSGPSLHDIVAGLHQLQETTKGLAMRSSMQVAPPPERQPSDPAVQEISHQLDGVKRMLTQLNDALALGVTCLLSEAGKLEVDEAEKWVAQFLKSPRSEKP